VNHIVQAVDTAAMVLGYLVLALLIGIVLFIASAWLDKWSYQRKKSRRHDDEWARVRSKWLLEGDIQRARTDEYAGRLIRSIGSTPRNSATSPSKSITIRRNCVVTLRSVIKISQRFIIDNSPTLLSGVAVTGTLAVAYLTGKATFKASELLEEEAARVADFEPAVRPSFNNKDKAS
jgi:hypothetical protein